jgi:4-azaleucine resistance transporter AzlC
MTTCTDPGEPSFKAGLTDVAPVLVGLVPFALVLGALAAAKGLSPLEVMLMSGLVFAGGSQFVAVELWRDPAPLGVLALMALLVNSRHLLMGAALAPRTPHWQARAWPALFLMADEVWALALRRAGSGPVALSYWYGLAAGLWLNWVALTGLGAWLGRVIEDPARLGFDFAFVAVFVALLHGMWHGRTTFLPWLASGAVAVLVYLAVPGPWYVAAGALAGLATALLTAAAPETDAPA